jgi:hypothetical protein
MSRAGRSTRAAPPFVAERRNRMAATTTRVMALYVDKASQRWIVQDAEGNSWSLPRTDNPWEERQPFSPAEETELEPAPGHYKNMLGLPS